MAGVLAPRVSAVEAMRQGWARASARGVGAVLVVWAVLALLSALVVAPAWAWWSGALAHTIDGARLLGSPNVSAWIEVTRETPYGVRMILLTAVAGAAMALLLNAFLAGGLIGALVRDPADLAGAYGGRVAHFAADGLRFYGPLLRVALIVWPIAGAVIGAVALLAAIPFAGTSMPALALAASGTVFAIGTMVAAMFVDLARIHIVRTDVPWAGAALLAALRIVGRQARQLVLLAIAFGLVSALAIVLLIAVRGWIPGQTWPWILGGVVVQQAHALARTWLRAVLIASEEVLVEADAAARGRALAVAASVAAALEERPEVLVVVQREAGEGRLPGDEGRGSGDLAAEIPGRLVTEGDARRGDADAEEAGPASPAVAGDRRGGEPPPVA